MLHGGIPYITTVQRIIEYYVLGVLGSAANAVPNVKDRKMAFVNETSTTNAAWNWGFLANVANAIHRGVQAMQVARMTSVLHSMTDQELTNICVARNEIAQHAETLITGTAPSK